MSSSPSTLLLASSCAAAAAFALGYTVGSRGPLGGHLPLRKAKETAPDTSKAHDDDEKCSESDDSEEEDESLADGDLSVIQAGFMEPCKMVLAVRVDLNMTPGKVAAQCGHATLACYKALVKKNPQLVKHWERTGQAKIALKAKSEDQLLELEAIAKSLNLCARSIQDAGHTQVDPGTRTVLAIGPAPVELINQVTGKLRLF
ncbi:peptidyl-tRNA hydrolase [Pleurotus pulmonarius]